MTVTSTYRRLAGSSGFLVRNSLWLGADHLLSVRRNPFSESYRRYYFADIQALALTELPDTVESSGYVAAGFFVVAAATLVYNGHPVWGALCALAGLALLFLSRRMANCACYLKTSTSSETLPSLGRLGNARKGIELLKTEIERVQGSVSAERILADSLRAGDGAVVAARAKLRHCGGQVHWAAFACMLIRGVLGLFALTVAPSSIPLGVAESIGGTLVLLFLILAAIQQRRSDLALNVRRIVAVALVFYIASALLTFASSIYVAVLLQTRAVSRSAIMSNPAIKLYGTIDVIGFLALGCAGLIMMWLLHQRAAATPPPMTLGNSE